MTKNIIFFTFLLTFTYSSAQERVITTGVPFLMVAADARAAGMADIGIATSQMHFPSNGIQRNMPFLKKTKDFQ